MCTPDIVLASSSRRVTAGDYDTWLLQSRMMAQGLSVKRLPGGVILGNVPGGNYALAFVGTLPKTTSFEGMALSLRLSSAWKILAHAGLGVPDWKSFNVGAVLSVGRYTESLGYPVMLSGAKGERSQRVKDGRDLAGQMRNLREAGFKTVIARSHAAAAESRFLVLGDDVIAQSVESGTEPAPEFQELAIRAVAAIPGLNFGEVRLAAGLGPSSRGMSEAVVTGFNTAPRLLSFATSDAEVMGLADRLLRAHAGNANVSLCPPMEQIRAVLTFSGAVDSMAFSNEVLPLLAELGCAEISPPTVLTPESVQIEVMGAPDSISEIAVNSLRGLGRKKLKAHIVNVENC